MVRHKTHRFAAYPETETDEHKKYREDMGTYLTENGQVLLDYTLVPDIKAEHYNKKKKPDHTGNDHLTNAGRVNRSPGPSADCPRNATPPHGRSTR